MTLIDYFNAFQAVTKAHRFSANARSLYFAILGEFNSLQYPTALKLYNTDLQKLSGINSTSAFDSARTALINANLISHKKQVYSLKDCRNISETIKKEFRNTLESFEKAALVSTSLEVYPEEKDKEKNIKKENTTTAATARAREGFLKEISPKIAETWLNYEGEKLNAGQMIDLYGLEQLYGSDAVVKAIIAASRSNTRPRLSYNFLKAFLENQQKGATTNDQHGKYNRIDICPE